MTEEIKKIALQVAKKGGEIILEHYNNFDREKVVLKSKYEIVTKADMLSEEVMIKEIRKNFPLHSIISEENGKIENVSDYTWIIDPLDGTTNFSMHNPFCSLSIAVAKDNELIFGLVYAPVLKELYLAEKNKGAFLDKEKIRVSKINEGKIIHTFCHGSNSKAIKKAIRYYSYQKLHGLDCRQLGSAALELAYVASGRIESIFIPNPNIWDIAAGVLLVKEAGGKVTDAKGNVWNLASSDMAASNGKVHNDIIKITKNI